MIYNSQKKSQTQVIIALTRKSDFWHWLRIVALIYCLWLSLQAFYPYFVFSASLGVFLDTSASLHENPIYYSVIGILGFFAFSVLLRPRYIILDHAKGQFYYSFPIIGGKNYYYVEVKAVQLEVDMSKVLHKLQTEQLHRIFLKLQSNKCLLVHEETSEEIANAITNQLREIFQVDIEHLHRVGRKRDEINLGRYKIEKELCHGGMGKVFIAREKKTGRKVALKVLPASLAIDTNYITHFARETRILQKLSHPNVIKIVEVGREKGDAGEIYFYSMDFIEGKPLSTIINEGNFTIKQIVRMMIQISLALDYVHRHGVIHRDIKPNNIMVPDAGGAVLIDFGIARDISWAQQKSTREIVSQTPEISHYIGTLPYMSPEQLSSRHYIDYRTDIYSLGVTLYEILTSKRAFKGSNQIIYRSILAWTPPSPITINPDIPEELDIITMRAIAKKKKDRYQSGAQMAEDLHRWLHGFPITSVRPHRWKLIWQKIRGFFRWLF